MDASSILTPVVDNANMFQDDFLLYEDINDGSIINVRREQAQQQAPESNKSSGSECTSLDGGSNRDDSSGSDEGGDVDDNSNLQQQIRKLSQISAGGSLSRLTKVAASTHDINDGGHGTFMDHDSVMISAYSNNSSGSDINVHNITNDNMSNNSNNAVISSITNNSNNNNNNNKRKRQTPKSATEDQKVERRDRNREHAKRSRLRKKSMLKSLQSSLEALQRQNTKLKMAITDKVQNAEQIMKKEINNIHAVHCPIGQSHESLLEESQRKFLVRVETDVDLISNLLN